MKEVFSLAIAFFGKSLAIKIVIDGFFKKKDEQMVKKEELLLQTDSKLDKWINSYGCLFMSLIFYYLFYNRALALFVPSKVNELYAICVKTGAIDSDGELQWSPALAEIHKFFKCRQEFLYEERISDSGGDGTVDGEVLSETEPVIGRYDVKDAKFHFVIVYKKKIYYNPDPTAILTKFNRYDKLDKK